jgi:hypothetical protein
MTELSSLRLFFIGWTAAAEHSLNRGHSTQLQNIKIPSTKPNTWIGNTQLPSSYISSFAPPTCYCTPLSWSLAGTPHGSVPPVGSQQLSPNALFPIIMQPIPSALTLLWLPWRWRQQALPKQPLTSYQSTRCHNPKDRTFIHNAVIPSNHTHLRTVHRPWH